MNLQLHLLLLLILLLHHVVVYCLDVRFTNTCMTRSSRWMNHNMHCNSVVAGPSHHSFFREQSNNSQNYNNHRILNTYSKDLIQSRHSNNVHFSMKNDKSDVNNKNDDDNDDGWASSTLTTTTSTLSNDNDIKRDKMIKELGNLKKQQQEARSNKLEKLSTNDNDNEQRDLFIPIVTIISIVGFGSAYLYETIRLYRNGELYLPFLSK